MLSQSPLSLTVIGGAGLAISLLVLVDNLRQIPDDTPERGDKIVENFLGEDFRQGVQEARGKTPTTPNQMGEEANREAREQAQGMEQDIEPDMLLNGMGASKCPIELLHDGEVIQYLVQSVDFDVDGEDNGSPGYGLVTDSRIVVAAGNLGLLTTEISSQHSISYRDISDISTGMNMVTTTLEIRTPGHEYEITGVDGEIATKMAEYIRRQISQRDQPRPEDNSEDSLDKLERLSDLRGKDAITESEYEQKKAELLEDV